MSSSFICLTSNSLRASSWMKHPAIELARLMMVWTQDMIRDMPIYFITKTFEEWNCFSMLMMLCFQVSYVNILIFDSVYYVYIYIYICVCVSLYTNVCISVFMNALSFPRPTWQMPQKSWDINQSQESAESWLVVWTPQPLDLYRFSAGQ